MHAGRLILFVILLLPEISYSQNNDSLRSTYVHRFSEYFYIGPLIKKQDLSFDIFSADDPNKIYTFKANNSYGLGAAVNLFGINLEAAFSIPLASKSQMLYGKSDVSDFSLRAISKSWIADAYTQRYDGFYIQSPDVVIPKGQPSPQRQDLATRNFGMSFTYILNHNKFSLRSSYIFTERQKISKGSFLLNYVLSSFSLAADSAMVPQNRWATWGDGANVNNVRFTSLGFGPGYSYNIVLNRFFLNLTLGLGPAHYWVRYTDVEGVTRNDIRIDFYSIGRVGVGYNGDRFFGGINLTTQGRNVTYERTTFQNTTSTVRIVAGMRLLEKGFMKKSAIDILQGK